MNVFVLLGLSSSQPYIYIYIPDPMQVTKFTALMSIEQTPQQLHMDCWGLKKLFSLGLRRWGVRIGGRKDWVQVFFTYTGKDVYIRVHMLIFFTPYIYIYAAVSKYEGDRVKKQIYIYIYTRADISQNVNADTFHVYVYVYIYIYTHTHGKVSIRA